jgi:xanthine/uracil/vitamin C permease (AzgA family)
MRQFQDDAIASTCISAMLATFLMAWVARMPLAVAPAMSSKLAYGRRWVALHCFAT